MSYDPTTDFMALFRQTSSGAVRSVQSPVIDIVLSALSRAGLFTLSVSATAPTANQTTTAWLQPAVPSWSAEGTLWLWNAGTAEYEPATPALFYDLLQASG